MPSPIGMGFEKVPQMVREFKRAVKLRPDLGYTHYWYAEGLKGKYDLKLDNTNLIIGEAKKAVELDPRQVSAYFILKALARNQRRVAEADTG